MKCSVAILMGLFVSVNVLAYTVADGWTIRQITNSEYIPLENEVKISGNNIIWKEFVDAESADYVLEWNDCRVTVNFSASRIQ